MIDSTRLRHEFSTVQTALKKKHFIIEEHQYQAIEQQRCESQQQLQRLQAQRNQGAKDIAIAKKNDTDTAAMIAAMQDINAEIKLNQQQFEIVQQQLQDLLDSIPNIPDASVPIGSSAAENEVVKITGAVNTTLSADHVDLGEKFGLDFGLAAKLAGARFVILRGPAARLHRALAAMMLDTHINEHNYQECYVPYLVSPQSAYGTGQLPKFAEDIFFCKNDSACLIPTAEIPLSNFLRETITTPAKLPLKLVAHSPCFRREAGSYGTDNRGMFRQHQFDKVEMVQLVEPSNSWQAHEEMLSHAERILQKLELAYRVVNLCGGDLGFAAAKTYDLEVWLPSQQTYREISSVSNCLDFQARRMQSRVKINGENVLIHTLNGSGVAVGRALLAIIENHSLDNGDIAIPKALQPYLGNQKTLSPIS